MDGYVGNIENRKMYRVEGGKYEERNCIALTSRLGDASCVAAERWSNAATDCAYGIMYSVRVCAGAMVCSLMW